MAGKQDLHPVGGLRLGHVTGSPVYVTPSWFLFAIIFSLAVGPRVDSIEPGLGAWKYLAGFAFAVVLLASILIHEAAHTIAAQRLGYETGPIVLHFLGGHSTMLAESRRPRDQFIVGVVGPLASLAIAGVGFLGFLGHPTGLIRAAVWELAGANLIVGAFNLLPGLPLDGGLVLRSGLWALTKNAATATRIAAWCGRLLAILVLLVPFALSVANIYEVSTVNSVLFALVALTMWTSASSALGRTHRDAILNRMADIHVRDLTRRTLTVPDDLPLAEAVRRAHEAEAGSIVTVTADGRPLGIVHEGALAATPQDRRPWLATSTVTRALTPGLTVPADIGVVDLLKLMQAEPSTEYLALEADGSICGVVSAADVDAAFRQSAQ
ncbi:peptidase M50 [Nocardioides baekrokdamisoli]|uniref:Zinc metalloprotease n=1 Tax=Nocardioides baekrokdamisoli TaxID=1804624 RepID=A0A3G9IAZ8_9ACTN|nr:site-2 protease family protein [Nocardioides baekrokdamisoli]BBH15940.1 peptidase M50 [Nocardioides baekrokdamisoli]